MKCLLPQILWAVYNVRASLSENATAQEEQRVSSTGSSEPQSPKHSDKHNCKTAEHEKIYTVASHDTISNLMSQYKRHKQAKTMPTFVKAQRSKPAPVKKNLPKNSDPIDMEIHQQQESSIMKVLKILNLGKN